MVLSRIMAMFLASPLGIVMNSSRNRWASPESIQFWALKMRWSHRGLTLPDVAAEKGIHVLGGSTFDSKLFFFDTMNFQISR